MAKLNVLKSIAQNIGNSIGSGIGLMVGHYEMAVYDEAAASENGYLLVDILKGHILEGTASSYLKEAISLYSKALPEFCVRHGVDISDFQARHIRFGLDRVYGGYFKVMVTDKRGRSGEAQYYGSPARRMKVQS